RWRPANRTRPCAEDYQSPFETRRLDPIPQFHRLELDAYHQPETAHVDDGVVLLLKLLETSLQISTNLSRILYQPAFEQFDCLQRRGDANGIAAKRRCMCARFPIHQVCTRHTRTDRQTRTDA